MSMTSGATKAVEAIMDAGAVVHGVQEGLSKALDETVSATCRAKEEALALRRADEFLRAGLEFSDVVDKDAMVCRARREIEKLLKRSLSEGGPLLRLAKQWVALLERADSASDELADLVSKAARGRSGRKQPCCFALGETLSGKDRLSGLDWLERERLLADARPTRLLRRRGSWLWRGRRKKKGEKKSVKRGAGTRGVA